MDAFHRHLTEAVPSVAACTERAPGPAGGAARLGSAYGTHGCLEGDTASRMPLRVRILRDVERTERGLECSHHGLPSGVVYIAGWRSLHIPTRGSVPPRSARRAPPGAAHTSRAGAWVCAPWRGSARGMTHERHRRARRAPVRLQAYTGSSATHVACSDTVRKGTGPLGLSSTPWAMA